MMPHDAASSSGAEIALQNEARTSTAPSPDGVCNGRISIHGRQHGHDLVADADRHSRGDGLQVRAQLRGGSRRRFLPPVTTALYVPEVVLPAPKPDARIFSLRPNEPKLSKLIEVSNQVKRKQIDPLV